jgi:hypothetical protein
MAWAPVWQTSVDYFPRSGPDFFCMGTKNLGELNTRAGGRIPPNFEPWLGRPYGRFLSVISRDRAPTFFLYGEIFLPIYPITELPVDYHRRDWGPPAEYEITPDEPRWFGSYEKKKLRKK